MLGIKRVVVEGASTSFIDFSFTLSLFSLFIGQITAEISPICSKLVETAKLCVSSNDKYLQSTMRYLDKNLQTFPAAITSIAI